MALILEIRDRKGSVAWHRLDGRRLTIGRALANDVIVDDPYADGRHAVIEPAEASGYQIADLQSLNGTFAAGVRLAAPTPLVAGMEMQLGRTMLRVRDEDEAVPPAVADTTRRIPTAARWALTPRGGLAVMTIIVAVSAFLGWSSSTSRSTASDALGGGLAGLAFTVLWAGIWGLATRGADRRFRFRPHLLVIATAFLVVLVDVELSEWLTFYFPGASLLSIVFGAATLLIIGGVVVAQLGVAGSLTARGRLYAGVGVIAALVALAALGSITKDEKFSDVPAFSFKLKPVPGGRVPAMSVDEFTESMTETKAKADEAVAK